MRYPSLALSAVLLLSTNLCVPAGASARRATTNAHTAVTFSLAPASPAMAACLPGVTAKATVTPGALNDTLTLQATGLPSFAGFDLYLSQLPHTPFGLAWPLGMLHADAQGTADITVQAVLLGATGMLPAGVAGAAATAAKTTHLVLFFDNPRDADPCFGAAGAPTTPFNAQRAAGPAVLATTGFPDAGGPLQGPAFTPPGLGSSHPTGGHSFSAQPVVFTSTCTDRNGWTAIRFVDFRLTDHGTVVFWARLDRPAKRMYVYDMAARRWQGGNQPGKSAVLGTPAVQLQLATSAVLGTLGATGSVRWTLIFTKLAAGKTFQQSVQVTDLRYQTLGWNPSGAWSVDR